MGVVLTNFCCILSLELFIYLSIISFDIDMSDSSLSDSELELLVASDVLTAHIRGPAYLVYKGKYYDWR
jgi:hypothetical protein